jgi:peptidoglycan-associated lipoprotein
MRPLYLCPLAIALAACAHAPQVRPNHVAAPAASAPQPTASPIAIEPSPALPDGTPPSAPIYFGFDDALLSRAAEGELDRLGDYLHAHPAARVAISGHTDERGTEEYNLALGDRRAQAAREYLQRLGIDGARLRTISYGKLRPVATGHDEAAWRQNRRDEIEMARDGSSPMAR